jgi:Na+/melibiose symporter-like transporter
MDVTPSAENIFNLAMVQGPLVAILMFIPFGIFSIYGIDRYRHQEILAKLEET